MNHEHKSHGDMINKMALAATLHCLTGCAMGEVTGLLIGTAFELNTIVTLVLSTLLAFVFGFTLSAIPLVRSGLTIPKALSVVVFADTLSIATMEVVDNVVMAVIPGAMNAGLVNPIFWLSMPLSLFIAFWVAYPVNKALLKRNKGHALTMQHMEGHSH